MSSSLLSKVYSRTGEAGSLEDQGEQFAGGCTVETHRKLDEPPVRAGERPAFYGIFLGHQDGRARRERQRRGSSAAWSASACGSTASPAARRPSKNAFRWPMPATPARSARERPQAPPLGADEVDGIAELQARRDGQGTPRHHACCPPAWRSVSTTASTRSSARRLAQGSGGQQLTVAEPTRRIHHRDLEVAREAQVLQSIVADHDVGARLGGTAGRRDAVGAGYHDLRPPQGVQHGLVADLGGIAVRVTTRDPATDRPP